MRRLYLVGAAILASVTVGTCSATGTVISGGSSAAVDGWNITVPVGDTITALDSGSTLDLDYAETFVSASEVLPVGFQQVVDGDPATTIDILTEAVSNSTGVDWNAFNFSIDNLGTPLASFDGSVFVPPSSAGVNYETATLNAGDTFLSYAGTQAASSTSIWGSNNPGDFLLIDVPNGSDSHSSNFPARFPNLEASF